MFNEITYSYNILSDPDKRQQYDSAGFEVTISLLNFNKIYKLLFHFDTIIIIIIQAVEAENQDLELDLSSLGAMNTMFAAIFRSFLHS